MNFSDAERAALADFDNASIQITCEGVAGRGPRGESLPSAPVVVLATQSCQVWDLSASESAALTGEEVAVCRKVRLHDYHENLTEKMTAIVDGKEHNVILCSDDGTKCFSILTLRLIKS